MKWSSSHARASAAPWDASKSSRPSCIAKSPASRAKDGSCTSPAIHLSGKDSPPRSENNFLQQAVSFFRPQLYNRPLFEKRPPQPRPPAHAATPFFDRQRVMDSSINRRSGLQRTQTKRPSQARAFFMANGFANNLRNPARNRANAGNLSPFYVHKLVDKPFSPHVSAVPACPPNKPHKI